MNCERISEGKDQWICHRCESFWFSTVIGDDWRPGPCVLRKKEGKMIGRLTIVHWRAILRRDDWSKHFSKRDILSMLREIETLRRKTTTYDKVLHIKRIRSRGKMPKLADTGDE